MPTSGWDPGTSPSICSFMCIAVLMRRLLIELRHCRINSRSTLLSAELIGPCVSLTHTPFFYRRAPALRPCPAVLSCRRSGLAAAFPSS